MKKAQKKILLCLALIVLPVVCLLGIFSINNNSIYDTTTIESGGVLSLLSGEFYGTNVSDEDSAFKFLDSVKSEYGFNDAKFEFGFEKKLEVSNGYVYRFYQQKHGLKVYGRQVSVAVDTNGRVLSVSGNYKKSNAKVESINIELFKDYAKNNLGINEIYDIQVVVYNQIEDIDSMCYLANCEYDGEIVDIVIDAKTYEFYQIVSSTAKINNLSNYTFVKSETHEQYDASGKKVSVVVETYKNRYTSDQVYLLSDKSRKIYMTVMANGKSINSSNFFEYYLLDSNLTADDPMVVEAYKNLVKCYDYYANAGSFGTSVVGLKNEAGKPINLIAVVHAVEKVGQSYDNAAYWILNSNSSYAYFLFGDGGSVAQDYASSLDVVAHEYQHGVTTSICNLEYLNEAGAINEAVSDIFGAIIEGHELSDKDFWLMGEDITVRNVAFRDMSNPKNKGLSDEYPSHTTEMYPLCTKKNCDHSTDDYGGVHYNSLILTYATYKMYEYNPEFFTKYRIGELWFNTLARLTTTATFTDFRVQMLASANALGYTEEVITTINRAFFDVGLVSGDSEFTISFYDNQQDFDSQVNPTNEITAIYGTSISLPYSYSAPEGKLFCYWVDGNGNKYKPGSKYTVPFENSGLWALYVDASEISSMQIQLSGEGTTINPYEIYSAVEWVYMSNLINNSLTGQYYYNKEYVLKSDIDLNNIEYTPIGTEDIPFVGYIYGSNHTIFGLNLSKSGLKYAGLFGVSYGSICNIAVGFGTTVSTATYTGAIVGANYGYISNCANKLNIESSYTVGGLAGVTYSIGSTSIANSYNEGNLSGDIVGGIVGDAVSLLVTRYNVIASSYIGNVYCTGDLKGNIVGGIAGRLNGYYIVNSMMTGNINIVEDAGEAIAGGIVGYLINEPLDESSEGGTNTYAGILSCKVVSNISNDNGLSGLLIGKALKSSIRGHIIIENNIMKTFGELKAIGNIDGLTTNERNCLYLKDNKFSNDGIYEGDFDFDNPDYYFDSDNWSVTRCISLYNLESVWTIAENKQMPKILNYEFWISYVAPNFSGGFGSIADPFLIGSAEELALLSAVVSSDQLYIGEYTFHDYFSNKAYKLIADIDLSGKIWVGIGSMKYTHYFDKSYDIENFGFSGSFDGNGHTISGMNAISVYSSQENEEGIFGVDYYSISYNAGLFGLIDDSTYSNTAAYIKNLNMRNVSVSGSYTGAVVAQTLSTLQISNVKIHSGNINGSTVAGGIVGYVGNNNTDTNVLVSNSMNNARIAARIVGGIIGVVENQNSNYATTATISASVNRGTLVGIGDEVASAGNYFMAFVGGMIGVVNANNIELNDNIFIGDILMYTPGFAGGLVGATGYTSSLTNGSEMIITSKYNKISGNIEFKFDNSKNYFGTMLGAVLANTNLEVVINDQNSKTKIDAEPIGVEQETPTKNIGDLFSNDEANYDYENMNYYSSAFSSASAWSNEAISNMIVRVRFVDWNGNVLHSLYVKYGGTVALTEAPTTSLVRESTAKYHYTYKGWGDFGDRIFDVDSDINAIYDNELRSYKVVYKLEGGDVVLETVATYGSEIDKNIKAPEKKGNFFFDYEFSGWQFESDTVIGDMVGVAKYKPIIATKAIMLISAVIVSAVVAFVIVNHFKSKKNDQENNY